MNPYTTELSDTCLRDLHSGHLSAHGQRDAAFEAGYVVLMHALPRDVVAGNDHPSPALVVKACTALGVTADVGEAYAMRKYSGCDPDSLPSVEALLSWSESCRRAVGIVR